MEPLKGVVHDLEQIMARFFWGTTAGQRKRHWVSWRQICHPFDEGGLGVRSFEDLVTAFGYKLWWRLLARDSLWARFTIRKYCILPHHVYTTRCTVHDSPIWRRLCRIRLIMSHHVRWSVGSGEISFWDDVWFGDRTLRSYTQNGVVPSPCSISYYLRDHVHLHEHESQHGSAWHLDRLHQLHQLYGVPTHVVDGLSALPIEWGARDQMRWALTSHGEFSVTSAWEDARHRMPRNPVFGQIWGDCLTPTVSVFLWRLLHGRIPVDSLVQSHCRVSLASRCLCCQSSPSVESVDHLFVSSPAARFLWQHFTGWFSSLHAPAHTSTTILLRLGYWWRAFHRVPAMHISFLIPCLLLWFIWTERNSCKHRSVPFRTSHVVYQVTHQLRTLVMAGKLTPRHWQGCTPPVDFMPPYVQPQRVLRSTLVSWRPPGDSWIKLNTDGSFTPSEDGQSPALAGGGGVIRDPDGAILAAYCVPLSASSSFEAELLALLHGLNIAKDHGRRVWIEMDSAAVVAIFTSGHLGAADVRHPMAQVRVLLRQLESRFSHIYREGNRVADYLAGRGVQTPVLTVFDAASAPPRVKVLARMDQLGYPNFRFRYRDA